MIEPPIESDNHYQSKIQIKKDYQPKEFVNPYFRREKKPTGFNTRKYLNILGIILVIYLLIYSPLLKIDWVEFFGQDMITTADLEKTAQEALTGRRWLVFPKNNMLFFSKKSLSNHFASRYNLKKITINRGWRALTITLEENVSFVIIYNVPNKKFYFSDLSGQITKEIPEEEITKYWERFPILNLNREEIAIDSKIVGGQTINFIIALDKFIRTTDIKVRGYELAGEEEIILVTKDNWRAYFDANTSIKTATENLVITLNKIKSENKKVKYIDLRFEDKIFYQ